MNLEASTESVAGTVPGFDALTSEAAAEALDSIRRASRELAAAIHETFAPLEQLGRQTAACFAAVTEAAAFARVTARDILRTARRRGRSVGGRLRRRTVDAIRAARSTLRAVWPGRRRLDDPQTKRTRDDLEPAVARCQRPRTARTLAPTAPAVMYGRTFSPNAPPHRPVHVTGHRGIT